jgi:hypothetical protein
MRLLERRSVRAGVFVILVALALLSAAQGLHNAIEQSQDLQWSGTRMLLRHIDPWIDALQQDPHHMILKSQIPNYLPLLYLLMLPLGVLPPLAAQVIWGLCNLGFAAISAWLAARFYGLGRSTALAILCLMWMATPTRVTIGNGQCGLLVLVLWCISLLALRMTDTRAMIAGVSYVKYNFAPPLFLYLLMKDSLRRALISLVPVLVGGVVVCLWLGEWHSLSQIMSFSSAPLRVADTTTGYFPRWGGSNLMDMIEPTLFRLHVPTHLLTPITTSVAFLVWGIFLYFCLRRSRSAVGWHMALLGLASYALFRHHSYDAVTLLFPLCYAFERWRSPQSKLVIAVVAYCWYLQKLLGFVDPYSSILPKVEFLLLVLAMALVYRIGPEPQPAVSHAPAERPPRAPALH